MSLFSLLKAKELADGFCLVLNGLCRAIGDMSKQRPDTGLLYRQVWDMLRRRMARFTRLAERAALGQIPRPNPTPSPGPRATASEPPPTDRERKPRVRLRGRFAWLCEHVPYEAAGCGSRLRHLLTLPDMQALLAADPAVRGMVKALLHMTGASIDTAQAALLGTRPTPPPRIKRPAKPAETPWHRRPISPPRPQLDLHPFLPNHLSRRGA